MTSNKIERSSYSKSKIEKILCSIENSIEDTLYRLEDCLFSEYNTHRTFAIMGACLGSICLIGGIVSKDNNLGRIIGYSGAGINYVSAIMNYIAHKT